MAPNRTSQLNVQDTSARHTLSRAACIGGAALFALLIIAALAIWGPSLWRFFLQR